ncbi:hypothetical protein Kpol_1056p18 [Vanderwaltozyma polyspora DSM 70294]|uniref:CN hydrolase domain-containing protein n=1 Tax=Vanderwaltozyma polyspora (strain ATCC 22028 / DSM 70294 / BCRC 21397 / CBS 2163 / NBRC 10782 / NRRL Y-8283 / UCD 57-17) TaxID=436907 RepID=A7TLM5_VANPO|nr:uncharacterized protein Kpol_1056p18 [Vanderwaltozyma polyspora DSM 70294]EDO16817.1 hypothetical protein Kpol_1056p18 [Vanderwaltozyma polyspora DSM 70294]
MNSRKISVGLNIAIVQLNPQIGQVKQTVSRVYELIDKFKGTLGSQKTPDLVVFPEFALTGYNFHSREHILPYLTNDPSKGVSFDLAEKVSKMFNCYTVIGYPERYIDSSEKEHLYNSAAVVDPDGKLVFNYRKSFLYNTDEEWGCEENPNGFQNFNLDFPGKGTDLRTGEKLDVSLNSSIGICMDLSPYKFQAPFDKFEFSTYNIDNNSELIICPMAWLHSSSYTNHSNDSKSKVMHGIETNLKNHSLPLHGSQGKFVVDIDENNKTERIENDSDSIEISYSELDKPDMSNVNYWLLRFMPFLSCMFRNKRFVDDSSFPSYDLEYSCGEKSYMGSTKDSPWAFKDKNATIVLANRCGVEDGTTIFAGSSGIWKFNGQDVDTETNLNSLNESVELLGNLGKCHEGIIMRHVDFEIIR